MDNTAAPAFDISGRTLVSERRAIYAESLAMSRELNRRNVELPWYISWNQHLMEITGNQNPRILLAPQYLLWVDPEIAVEPEGQGDTQGSAEIENQLFTNTSPPASSANDADISGKRRVTDWLSTVENPSPSHSHVRSSPSRSHVRSTDHVLPFLTQGNEDDDEEIIDGSEVSHITISTAKTTPDGKASYRIADFAIIYVNPQEIRDFPLRYRGFRIAHVSVQVLVENKRYIDRALSGVLHDRKVTSMIQEAMQGVIVQAAIVFRTSQLQSVRVIAASGPYWCTCLFHPAANTISNNKFHEYLRDERFLPHIRSTVQESHSGWSRTVRMGTPASDALLQHIHDALAVLPGRVA